MSDHKKRFWEKKYDWDRPSLPHQKLIAWALVVGERPHGAEEDAHRRPHRGQLPDVDFGRAVVDPSYRPLLKRIADFLWGGRGRRTEEQSARALLRAELTAALGERLATAYLGEDDRDDAPIRAPEGKSDKKDWSRAA